jgi:DNA-binding NarL/FixJ family response regulator
MIRILLIEDDPTFGPFLATELSQQEREIEVNHVESRDAALAALDTDVWDLIICDLKIPAEDGGLDAAVEHGLAVVAEAERISPGTPIIVLSAFHTIEIAQRLADAARQEDIYGSTTPERMMKFFQKSEVDKCLNAAKQHATSLLRLGEIEVTGTDEPARKRVLRVFASRQKGDRVRATTIGGGLSAASVMKVEVFRGGAQVARVLGRVAQKPDADREIAAYDGFIAPMLPNGLFTPRMPQTVTSAGQAVGIFYTLIGSGDVALFDVLRKDPAAAAALVAHLRQGTAPWVQASAVASATVRDIRRSFISDNDFAVVQELHGAGSWAAAEARTVQVRRGPQHNDLHGLNVLVDNSRPVMIDFAEVGESPMATDPVTLELSTWFHPRGVGCSADARASILGGAWWTGAADPAVAPLVQECRRWAQAVAAGDRERLACAYGYAVRQLKYDDTDKGLAAAIASAAATALLATF